MPSTLAIVLIGAGSILKKRRFVVAGLCILYIFSIPCTSSYLFAFLESGEKRIPAGEAPAADAIVVLSGAGLAEIGKHKVIEWQDPDRFNGGVQLYFSGKAPLLVFTGGWLPWDSSTRLEGDMLLEQALLMGIPASSILKTGKVLNTKEEADAVAGLLIDTIEKPYGKQKGTSVRILLVTSAYHMPRARMLFEKAGFEVVPFSVDFKSYSGSGFSFFKFLPNPAALSASETAIREIYGRLYYRFKL